MERRHQHRRLQRHERLTTALLVKISLWAISIVVIASAVTFTATYQNARQRVIDLMQQDLAPTLERNQVLFERIERHAEVLSEEFLERYQLMQNQPERMVQFDRWYQETSPGVLRLKPEFDQGTLQSGEYFQHLSAFLGPRTQPITDELKTRVIAAQHTLDAVGPAWQNVVGNTHFSMPENIIVMYSKESPWGLLADKDLVITDFSVVESTLQSKNPERRPNWTGLYYDISADVWTITYQRPVDRNGQHLVNASFDVALGRLLEDLTAKKRSSSEHLVLNAKGDLIAASNLSQQAMQSRSTLTKDTYQEPIYQAVSEVINANSFTQLPVVIERGVEEQLLIIDQIEGPDWWHVTLYPLADIRAEAMVLPVRLIFAGVGLVLLILLMTYWLIRREITKPLQEVATMASMIGRSDYQQALQHRSADINARGEVKQALDGFKTMASRFIKAQNELERKVEMRTAELAEANKKLDALAHLDGLTGLFNRRAFDQDLAAAIRIGEPAYLMMADIDEFKPYNDNYGHEAGDQALKKIAGCLSKNVDFRVYRYGGEELAAIIPTSDINEVRELLEAWRTCVVNQAIEHEFKATEPHVLTVSMGAAPLTTDCSAEDVIRQADRQLYRAKRAGKNCFFID
ncbi:MAG: GGDEF domain-containing protein [Idiomarina sp.]|uniref:diguanylate cyclase n=1 Tax=Idiomarina sp. TaxID=1874361 RepID=UPI000C543980|nr:diguanylate cyclase [Idiomarina sp.]MBT41933.1 GGDEF domain-containing protein [Idiomarina sp.]